MRPQLKNIICASFLAAATAAGEAEAHGPGDFMYGGYGGPYQGYGHQPPHETFLPEVFGPYGLLGQRGPLGPGAPLGRFFDPRFDPRFQQRQFPPMGGMPPVGLQGGGPDPEKKSGVDTPPAGMCNANNDSRYPNWQPCQKPQQRGGYVTGPDGKTSYVFPLPPGQ